MTETTKRREPALSLFAWTLFLVLAVFILYPLACVILQSLRTADSSWTLDAYRRVFSSASVRGPLANTIYLGLAVGGFSTFIGFIFAYAIERTDIGWKRFFRLTSTFPMISPPFVVALCTIILLGNNGWITLNILGGLKAFNIYGFWGLLLAETLTYFPTAFVVCAGLLGSIDPALEEAALNSGASRRRTFWSVLFPLSVPGLLSSFLLVFMESLADFANPLVLGGNFKVLSVEAYMKIAGAELDLSGGSVMALLLLVPALAAFVVQQRLLVRRSFVTMSGKPSAARFQRLPRRARASWWGVCLLLSAAIYLFYGTVVIGSFMKIWGVNSTWTTEHYRQAFTTQWPAMRDSLILAVIATPISGILGLAISYIVVRTSLTLRHAIEWSSMLTFAVPGTVVGIGYVLAFNRPPLELQGTWLAIVLLFAFRNAPVGIRAGITALRQMDISIEEASRNAGASRAYTVRHVLLPLLAPVFLSGLSFAFVRCMNTLSAVIFVLSGRWNLITVSIMNFFESGELSRAAALCVLLVGFVLLGIGVMRLLLPHKLRRGFVT